MALEIPTIPLVEDQLESARLFSNRFDMAKAFLPKAAHLAEIGVALGDFSEYMIKESGAYAFDAFDLFEMHHTPMHWGTPSEELFRGLTQREFFERRISPLVSELHLHEGLSGETLPQCSKVFDFIYIDGAHDYEGVKADGIQAHRLLKSGSIAIFNDYTHFDQFLNVRYGVIQAVNELVSEGKFKVVGFALEKNGFHDIALRKT